MSQVSVITSDSLEVADPIAALAASAEMDKVTESRTCRPSGGLDASRIYT
jgi:hypothetical protein